LHAENDPITKSLAAFQRGEIDFAQFHRQLEQAAEETSSGRKETTRPADRVAP
jgi:hypothetical protein